jgi:hypothetical protein
MKYRTASSLLMTTGTAVIDGHQDTRCRHAAITPISPATINSLQRS